MFKKVYTAKLQKGIVWNNLSRSTQYFFLHHKDVPNNMLVVSSTVESLY